MNKTKVYFVQKQRIINEQAPLHIDIKAYSIIFRNTYNYAMELIERMSSYIDGEGRSLPDLLSSEATSLYTQEAMAASTRLMQIASWLLLLRSALEGDMSWQNAFSEKAKICLNTTSARDNSQLWLELPNKFRDIVEQSLSLEARIRQLDAKISRAYANQDEQVNLVHKQLHMLEKKFCN